jgi:hypothetical protein
VDIVWDRIIASEGVHVLICQTCEYVVLYGEKRLQMWLRLKTLKWGHYQRGYNLIIWALRSRELAGDTTQG